jgi:hypothetical protein
MSQIIDLDALMPEVAIVKYGDKEIKVQPPSVELLLKLSSNAGRFKDADKLSPEELGAVIDAVTDLIYQIIPDLKDVKFNQAQLMALVNLISEMVMPPDSKELAEKGVTTDDRDPLDQSASSSSSAPSSASTPPTPSPAS